MGRAIEPFDRHMLIDAIEKAKREYRDAALVNRARREESGAEPTQTQLVQDLAAVQVFIFAELLIKALR